MEMQDGDIAQVVEWLGNDKNIGSIVQRVGMRLITLGKEETYTWDTLFKSKSYNSSEYRVKILPKGTLLEI